MQWATWKCFIAWIKPFGENEIRTCYECSNRCLPRGGTCHASHTLTVHCPVMENCWRGRPSPLLQGEEILSARSVDFRSLALTTSGKVCGYLTFGCKQVTMADFRCALSEVKPAFGAVVDTLELYRPNGMIINGPRMEKLLSTCKTLVNQVSSSSIQIRQRY